ncbi:MAG: restriction endonuclease subunit S [Acinetobacter sp.]
MNQQSLLDLVNLTTGKLNSNAAVEGGDYPFFTCSPETLAIDQFSFDSKALLLAGNNAEGNFCLKYYEGKFDAYQRTYVLTLNDESVTTYKYLFYFLKTKLLELKNNSAGSATKFLTLSILRDIQIPLPSLPEQKTIASVLSSLDDKIDLLHRQNKTLEAMAETLLIQHVLPKEDERSDGLHLLGDYLETISVTHKFPKPQVVFLNTSDIYKGKVLTQALSDVKGLPGQAKKSIKKGDILFSEIRPANGRYALIDFEAADYVVSTKLMVLRAKQPKLIGLLYFYLTNRQITDWLQVLAESRSGTFPQITFDQVADLELRLPQGNDLDNLIELLDDILLKQSANNKQIQTLEKLRDTLLPKLMSGEVRVQFKQESAA